MRKARSAERKEEEMRREAAARERSRGAWLREETAKATKASAEMPTRRGAKGVREKKEKEELEAAGLRRPERC